MKNSVLEIALSAILVLASTLFFYNRLAPFNWFWNAHVSWSIALIICWILVATGYYHQGFLIRRHRQARNVSVLLPTAVFFVQCILFVKGIYYKDWSLIIGAVIVNSGVLFSLYHTVRYQSWSLKRF